MFVNILFKAHIIKVGVFVLCSDCSSVRAVNHVFVSWNCSFCCPA